MRRLIWAGVVLAVLFTGWWGLAAWGISSSLTNWFDTRRAEGWQVDLTDLRSSGFPARIETTLVAPQLADPETGLALRLDTLTLALGSLWPGDVRVILPDTPIQLASPLQKWNLTTRNANADLNLHPGPALELENLSLTADDFDLRELDGPDLFSGGALTLALTQGDTPQTYGVRFDIKAFSPGSGPRAALLLPTDWPLVFDVLTAQADVTLDRPIDRATLEDSRPQPQEIRVHRAEARWGDMRLRATGSVTRDPQGLADGTLTIKAENWQQMLDLAETSGLLPSEIRPQAESVFASLAAGTGSTHDLDITLTFARGLTRLGFLPLGPAPSLIIR